MILGTSNIGVAGVTKRFFKTGNHYSLQIAVGQPNKEPLHTFGPLGFQWGQNFSIITNNIKFGDCVLDQSPLVDQAENITVLPSSFATSLGEYFHRNIAIGAVFYDLKSGSITELNRVIAEIERLQLLNTPVLVSGNEADKLEVEKYKFLDFYTTVTYSALERKAGKLLNQWQDNLAYLRQVLHSSWSLLLSLQSRDNYSAYHALSVALMAWRIGVKIGLSPLELEFLKLGPIFYDLGMLAVPDNILNKPTKLSEEEIIEVRKHPERSCGLISPMIEELGASLRRTLLEISRYHHHYYDGGGYPNLPVDLGEISLLTYIISMSDAFDAMTTKRLHKSEGNTLDDKKAEIEKNKGGQFHPVIADVLIELINEGISIQMQTELPLLEKEESERTIRRLSRFADIAFEVPSVAHELNNMLAVATPHSVFLLDQLQKLAGKMKVFFGEESYFKKDLALLCEDAEAIVLAVESMVPLVRGLMDLARENVSEQGFPLNDIIILAKTLAQIRYKRKEVKIESDLDESLSQIFGNKQKFLQIILNLLVNAFDATPSEGNIKIVSRRGYDFIQIEISDTGCGIPKEIQQRIFEPFFTTKSEDEGTGLGLNMVKKMTEEMGGQLDFMSEEGQGTTFILTFPLYKLISL